MDYDELMQSILTAQEQMLQHSIEANSVTLNGRKYGKLIENLPPNMKPTVFGMAVKEDYALPDDYDFLVQYEPPQPKTNGDAIRSMSDEELVEIFANNDCGYCRIHDFCFAKGSAINCDDVWLDWLKEEAAQ